MRHDPIGERYYDPLRRADKMSGIAFGAVALLSIVVLFVDKGQSQLLYDVVQVLFVVGAMFLFVLGLFLRLYFVPRAEDMRRAELLSNSFAVNLTHERTEGYYNNEVEQPVKRLAVSLLESSFFSKSIALVMLKNERIRIVAYTLIWMIAVLYRSVDLALISAIAQVVFGEYIVSRWIRLEWLRARFDRVYDGLFELIKTGRGFATPHARARVFQWFGLYETGKAYGGVSLSSRVFVKQNEQLSLEWQRIKLAAGLVD